jgi:hypothetical protein
MFELRYAFALSVPAACSRSSLSCLTLGIATNTTMFSVFDAMFLRPLPFPDADRPVSVTGGIRRPGAVSRSRRTTCAIRRDGVVGRVGGGTPADPRR